MNQQIQHGADQSHTPGPWREYAPEIDGTIDETYRSITAGDGIMGDKFRGFAITGFISPADTRLIAAAPELLDGCNALLGLLGLISGRDDLTPELREVLSSNHRVAEAEAAVAKATLSAASTPRNQE